MTTYWAEGVSATGRLFRRPCDSMLGREIFKLQAQRLGARIIREWTAGGDDMDQADLERHARDEASLVETARRRAES